MTGTDAHAAGSGRGAGDHSRAVRGVYLPESTYFGNLDFDADRASRDVARCVAQFASRYRAWPVGNGAQVRSGDIPNDEEGRNTLVDDLFDWVESWLHKGMPENGVSIGLVLYRDGDRVLDQHDGIPAQLSLTVEEFEAARRCWTARGQAPDLYYPANAERHVVESVERYGGVVVVRKKYSPKEWSERTPRSDLAVPDESSRTRRFLAACERFSREVDLRIATITEPEKAVDHDELQDLRFLRVYLDLVRLRAREGSVGNVWEFVVRMFDLMARQRRDRGPPESAGRGM